MKMPIWFDRTMNVKHSFFHLTQRDIERERERENPRYKYMFIYNAFLLFEALLLIYIPLTKMLKIIV